MSSQTLNGLNNATLQMTESQAVRVAIAICALKFRPLDQSYASYVLDLCAKFPNSMAEVHLREQETLWRNYALSVERDLVELQARHETDRINLLALRASGPAQASGSVTPVQLPSNKRVKKKKAVQTLAQTAQTDLDAVLNGLTNLDKVSSQLTMCSEFTEPCMVSIPGHDTLFLAFSSLNKLVDTMDDGQTTPVALLIATANRAMEAVRVVTRAILHPHPSLHALANTLDMISTTLSYMVAVVLPILILHPRDEGRSPAPETSVDVAIDRFLQGLVLVCTPIIRSFAPLSRSILLSVFSANGTPKEDDNRFPESSVSLGDLLSLLRRTVSIMDEVCARTGSRFANELKEHLGLEAVRELEKARLQVSRPQYGQTSLEERVGLLATKDIIWYMCNILHLMFVPKSAPVARSLPNESGQDIFTGDILLTNGVLKSFSGLISHLRLCSTTERTRYKEDRVLKAQGEQVIDEVGHCMILAVAEKIWLYYWCGGSAREAS